MNVNGECRTLPVHQLGSPVGIGAPKTATSLNDAHVILSSVSLFFFSSLFLCFLCVCVCLVYSCKHNTRLPLPFSDIHKTLESSLPLQTPFFILSLSPALHKTYLSESAFSPSPLLCSQFSVQFLWGSFCVEELEGYGFLQTMSHLFVSWHSVEGSMTLLFAQTNVSLTSPSVSRVVGTGLPRPYIHKCGMGN